MILTTVHANRAWTPTFVELVLAAAAIPYLTMTTATNKKDLDCYCSHFTDKKIGSSWLVSEDWIVNLVALKVVFCTYTWRWVSRELRILKPCHFPPTHTHKTESGTNTERLPPWGEVPSSFLPGSQIIRTFWLCH